MKRYIVIFVFSVIALPLFSQSQLPEKKTIYQKGDSIIWNKSLPLYIHISTGEEDYKFSKPMYLDTEGANYIRTKWEMDSLGRYVQPLREQLWTVYADSRAPVTKVSFISKEKYTFKGKTYYSDDVKAKLTSYDALSGVKVTYYSIDGSEFVKYDGLISFDTKKDINLKFYSVDNVGNVEDISEISYFSDKNNLLFGIDNTAPVSKINNSDSILSSKDLLVISSVDDNVGVSVIYYSIDGGGFKPYEKPITMLGLKDGKHKIEYYALDWINNQEETNVYEFYLDIKAPEIKIDESINELNSKRILNIEAIDNKSGVKKILVQLNDNGKFVEYNEPISIDIAHQKIKIVAIDNMGNTSVRIISYSKS